MIFVVAGTQDGRELVKFLLAQGYAVAASVVTDYGKVLFAPHENLIVNATPLDEDALYDYLSSHGIKIVVDASHPYAAQISAVAMRVCHRLHLPYIRYERPEIFFEYDKIVRAANYEAAAKLATKYAGTIFLTTGSRSLSIFYRQAVLQNRRIIARVLPTAKVLTECESLGLTPRDIIAMQGPFSEDLNREMFRQYDAGVIVTKNTGFLGGADTKLAAAKSLSLPVIVIDRPRLNYDHIVSNFNEVLEFLQS